MTDYYSANSIAEEAVSLNIVIQISRHFGLKINKAKSNIMIFNMKEQPDNIEDIEVVNNIRYLGLEIDKRNYFKSQRIKMIEKARKMANMTYSIIRFQGCNRLLTGKTYW